MEVTMRWTVPTVLVGLAFLFAILSAVAAIPLWIAVMLLALAELIERRVLGTVR